MCYPRRTIWISIGLLLVGWLTPPSAPSAQSTTAAQERRGGAVGLQVVAGSWFFDLLSLTQPSNPHVTSSNSPPKRSVQSPTEIFGYPSSSYVATNLPGRKSVRESPGYSNPYGQLLPPALTETQTNVNSAPTGVAEIEPPHELESSTSPGLLSFTDRNNLLAQEVAICQALTGLTAKQRQICLQHSGIVWAMLEGTRLGLHECVYQFKHEQWNCSAVNILYQLQMSAASSMPKVSGLEGVLQRGSRETAFLSSAWSAGVVQAITRACSRGQMGTCDCDPVRREGQDRDSEGVFTWGGCSDPIRFGMRLTRLFLDATDREHREAAIAREEQLHGPLVHRAQPIPITRNSMKRIQADSMHYRPRHYQRSVVATPVTENNSTAKQLAVNSRRNQTGSDAKSKSRQHGLSPQELQVETLGIIQTKARSLMNLHNRRAGRRLVWTNRVRKCKCHGVSGACSMRTCWQRVNEFRRVGSMLKTAYDEAVRVTYEPRIDRLKPIDLHGFNARIKLHYGTREDVPTDVSFNNGRWGDKARLDWFVPLHSRAGEGTVGGIAKPLMPATITPDYNTWRRQRRPRSVPNSRQVSKGKLVYLEESPNYCRFDPTIGHLGIAGRLCNASSTDAPNSCNRLCCDRGYDTFEYESERKCDCKFFWCCEVRCKVCRERTVEHRCKH